MCRTDMLRDRFASIVLWGILAVAGPLASIAQADTPRLDTAKIDEYVKQRLEKDKYPSLSIGIVYDRKLIFAKAYGLADRASQRKATSDTIYRIGSVTKVFTTTLMAMLRDQGRLRLDDPVAKYLPEGVTLTSDPRGAPAITLRHLATHSSGLPRIPTNLTPQGGDFYNGYTIEQLYAGLPKLQLENPIGSKYSYSNFGVGLLGHVLERATGQSYEQLLRPHLLEPLGMKNTTLKLSPEQQKLFATGYNGDGFRNEAPEWNLGCLAPAGALASSVTDLARFLSLQMCAGQPSETPVSGGTLTELHTPQRLAGSWDMAVGLGWHVNPIQEIGNRVWHNGGVAGHFAFIGFVPEKKMGVIVLTNAGRSVDDIGDWLLAAALESLRTTTQPKVKMTQPTKLPNGEQVIADFVDATGGVKAYESIKSIVMRGKGTVAGLPVTLESYNAIPAKFYMKMLMGQMVFQEQGTDGEMVWQIEPLVGASIKTGAERDALLREAYVQRETQWRKLYKDAACLEVTDFDGHTCFKVKMVPHRGPDEIRYYDMKSHLLMGIESSVPSGMIGDIPFRQLLGDYQEHDGIRYPFKSVTEIAGQKIVLELESIEYNVDIPPERFAIPDAVKQLLTKGAVTRPQSSTTRSSQ